MLSDENSGSCSNPANRYQPSDCNGMMSCYQVRSWVLFKIYCSFKLQVSVDYEFYFIAVSSHIVFTFPYKLLKLENFVDLEFHDYCTGSFYLNCPNCTHPNVCSLGFYLLSQPLGTQLLSVYQTYRTQARGSYLWFAVRLIFSDVCSDDLLSDLHSSVNSWDLCNSQLPWHLRPSLLASVLSISFLYD